LGRLEGERCDWQVRGNGGLKETIMLLLTTPNIPGDHKVLEVFDMVTIYQTIKVSQHGVIEGLLAKNRNEYKEVFDAFRNAVREYTTIF
jgi:hypothetical protein